MTVPQKMATLPHADQIEQGTSLWKDAVRRFLKNKMAVFGLGFVVLLALAALAAPLFVKSYPSSLAVRVWLHLQRKSEKVA